VLAWWSKGDECLVLLLHELATVHENNVRPWRRLRRESVLPRAIKRSSHRSSVKTLRRPPETAKSAGNSSPRRGPAHAWRVVPAHNEGPVTPACCYATLSHVHKAFAASVVNAREPESHGRCWVRN